MWYTNNDVIKSLKEFVTETYVDLLPKDVFNKRLEKVIETFNKQNFITYLEVGEIMSGYDERTYKDNKTENS